MTPTETLAVAAGNYRVAQENLDTRREQLAQATIVRAKALTTTPSQQLVRIWFDVKDIQQQTDAGTVVFGYRMSRRSHAKGALYVIPGATPDSILAAVGGAK